MNQPERPRSTRASWPWVIALTVGVALTGCGNDNRAKFLGIALGTVAITVLLLPGGERTQDAP